MKKLNSMSILVLNIIILLILVNFYKSSISNIDESKEYFQETQTTYNNYKNSKESLIVKQEVITTIKKIAKKLHISDIKIKKSGKKVLVNITNITLKKQEKFLNKVLNEKFILLKSKIEKNIIILEIGLE